MNLVLLYKNKKVLITGGLGFLGSNIVNEIVPFGAEVTIIDSLNPLYGGNIFNIENIKDKVKVIIGDIRDENLINETVKDKDIIFNLAAQVSYIDSNSMPFEDLDIDCKGQLVILEACRKYNKGVKIVFASSRMVLGKILSEAVDENHPTNPLSLYGIHKLTAEKYHLMYFKDYGVKSVILRITNPFGERQQIKHSKYSLPGWFMRLAMEGKTIKIFGDGNQLRDYIYGTDIARAFVLCAVSDNTDGEIYNCGYGESWHFKDMVNLIVKTVGSGDIEFVPWPENYERIETGDFKTDISKLIKTTGWKPEISIEDGIKRMVDYYKEHKDKYI